MRWLLNQGVRWLGSRLVQEVTAAAKPPDDGDTRDEEPSPDRPKSDRAALALLCETKLLFDAVGDEMSDRRRHQGDRFAVCTGKLAGKRVVVAYPLADVPNHRQLAAAIVDGHRPHFAMSVSEAVSLRDRVAPGSIVMASRVYDAAGGSLRIDGTPPMGEGVLHGGVQALGLADVRPVEPADAPLAEDHWSEPIARACGEVGLPLMVAAVVLEPPREGQSKELAAWKRQSGLAHKTGLLAGMMFKKRSGLADVWHDKQARWDAAVRLAKLVRQLLRS